MSNVPTGGRVKLILLALIFFGPLAASFFLYYFLDDWRPEGSTENGILLTPEPLSGEPLIPGKEQLRFKGKWSMVYVGEGECNDACRKALYESRQVRRSLGKAMDRVQRVFVVTDRQANMGFLTEEHPGLIVVTEPSPGRSDLLNTIGTYHPGDIFLVDPIGNLMMRFPTDTGMKGIKKDMVHLLKVSRIG
jgi:hypothetical protein